MSRALTVNRIAGLAALALTLAVTPSCNKTDKPGQAEAVVLVTGISTAGLSVASTADAEATLDYTLNPRNGSATTFFHSVTLTSYSVTFSPPVVAPMSGAISTGFCDMGASCAVTLVLVPNGSKPGAGTTVIASIDVEGKDVNDNPVNFEAQVALTFIP
jgi:hypothetical protein